MQAVGKAKKSRSSSSRISARGQAMLNDLKQQPCKQQNGHQAASGRLYTVCTKRQRGTCKQQTAAGAMQCEPGHEAASGSVLTVASKRQQEACREIAAVLQATLCKGLENKDSGNNSVCVASLCPWRPHASSLCCPMVQQQQTQQQEYLVPHVAIQCWSYLSQIWAGAS